MKFQFRRSLTTATFAAVAFTLAACSDSPLESSAKTTSLTPEGARLTVASTSVTTATLYPQYDNMYVSVEGHRIVIPAYSICQIGVSGYGLGFWDRSCAPQTKPIEFTITTSVDQNGNSRVTVSPDVRFVPGKRVMAYFKDAKGAATPGAYIAYCEKNGSGNGNGNSGKCYDEGKLDNEMTTYRDPSQGIIYRRLKHFSGYNVVFGLSGGIESLNRVPLSPSFLKGYITTVGFAGETEKHGDGGSDTHLDSGDPQ